MQSIEVDGRMTTTYATEVGGRKSRGENKLDNGQNRTPLEESRFEEVSNEKAPRLNGRLSPWAQLHHLVQQDRS